MIALLVFTCYAILFVSSYVCMTWRSKLVRVDIEKEGIICVSAFAAPIGILIGLSAVLCYKLGLEK